MIAALFNVIFPEFISFCGFQISTTCNLIDKIVHGLILWVVKSPLGYGNSGIRIDILLREVGFLIVFIQFITPENICSILDFISVLIWERVSIVLGLIFFIIIRLGLIIIRVSIVLIRIRVSIVLGLIFFIE